MDLDGGRILPLNFHLLLIAPGPGHLPEAVSGDSGAFVLTLSGY